MADFLDYKTLTLDASGSPQRVSINGSFFACSSADWDFEMSFNGQIWFHMAQGLQLRFSGDGFADLYFRSSNGENNNIAFYTGSVVVADSRLNLVKTVNSGNAALPIISAETFLVGASVAINPGSSVTIPGGLGGYQRKHIKITNLDAVNSLTVKDANGVQGGAVFAASAEVYETSGDVTLKNESGAAIAVAWFEVYYA